MSIGFTLAFDVTGEVGRTSPLTIARAVLNESAIPTAIRDGSLTIVNAGDATVDGLLDARDITKVERIIARLDLPSAGADANRDGQIDSLDLTKVERIIVGLD